jgi:hypothetical protein
LPRPIQHVRITRLPIPEPIAAGRLDTFFIEPRGPRSDLILDYHALVPDATPILFERDGKVYERLRGAYFLRRLRFKSVENIQQTGLYQNPDSIPSDHDARIIVDMYNWLAKGEDKYFYLLFGRSAEDAEICFHARGVTREDRTGEPVPVFFERDWSPAPPMPAGLVPQPRQIHQRFGGDPATFHLEGKPLHHRLFIGGLEVQPERRPSVDAVLNLGEEPSRWANVTFRDRWVNKGEGS